MRSLVPALSILAALLLAACASKGPADREAAALARYEAAAGAPVDGFRFFRLQGFTVLGDQALAVWTGPGEAWLLRVDAPCSELRWAPAIGLSAHFGQVSARFDRVVAGRDRCRITEIRPIDTAALRQAERASRAAVQVLQRESADQDSGG